MNLLFVIPEYPPHSGGGIVTFYRDILPEIVDQGHQVHVLVGSAFTSKLPSYVRDGVSVDFLDTDLVNSYLHKFSHYKAIPELQRHLAASWAVWDQVKGGDGYDLVEVTDWGMLFAPWIVSANSPPTVVQLHGSCGQIDFYDPQINNQLEANFLRLLEAGLLFCADELQTYSQSNVKAWQQLTNRDVRYIPPSLSLGVARSPQNYPQSNSNNGLVVGRIQHWKGVTVLCEALRLLEDKAPNIDWVGRDTVYQESTSLMTGYLEQNYGDIWGKYIHPVGTFLPEKTNQIQAEAKFIIVPSIWDVFNFACVEGMALGKVVLCSQGAGASGLITHEINGLVFKENDPQSLATCLEAVMGWSPSKLEEVGMAAKQTIKVDLNPKLIAQKRIEAYKDLIGRGKYPIKPNQWLIDAVSPHKKLDKQLAFLDRLPLSELVKYTIHRSLKKILKKT